MDVPAVVKTSTPAPIEGAANDDPTPARIITARRPRAAQLNRGRMHVGEGP
jgi:hypothetical protein